MQDVSRVKQESAVQPLFIIAAARRRKRQAEAKALATEARVPCWLALVLHDTVVIVAGSGCYESGSPGWQTHQQGEYRLHVRYSLVYLFSDAE
jgi:hypothetical protein